jgi:hypothetical protein
MARIRTVKPELFRHEVLYELEKETGLPIRLAWIGLFTVADREGRFKWRARPIKAEVFPYDEDINMDDILNAMHSKKLLVKYTTQEFENEYFGWIPTFRKHQVINNRENESVLPDPKSSKSEIINDYISLGTRRGNGKSACARVNGIEKGKGREGKGKIAPTIKIFTEDSSREIEEETEIEEPASQEHDAYQHHAAEGILLEVDERIRAKVSLGVLNGWIKKYGPIEWLKPEIEKICDQIAEMPGPPKSLIKYVADALRYARSVEDGVPVKNPYTETNKALAAYCGAYKRKYGVEPLINGMMKRQVSMFVARVGPDAPAVLEFYLNHHKKYYLETQHPVGAALKDAEGLHTQWKKGKHVSDNDIKQFQKTDALMSQLDRIDRGEI